MSGMVNVPGTLEALELVSKILLLSVESWNETDLFKIGFSCSWR